MRRYATETLLPHVIQDAENEVAEQGLVLANTLQEQCENTASELLSLRNLVTAAAAKNQPVLVENEEIDCARFQMCDGVAALAQNLNKVKADKGSVRKAVIALKDEFSTATGRMVDCQQEIQNAS